MKAGNYCLSKEGQKRGYMLVSEIAAKSGSFYVRDMAPPFEFRTAPRGTLELAPLDHVLATRKAHALLNEEAERLNGPRKEIVLLHSCEASPRVTIKLHVDELHDMLDGVGAELAKAVEAGDIVPGNLFARLLDDLRENIEPSTFFQQALGEFPRLGVTMSPSGTLMVNQNEIDFARIQLAASGSPWIPPDFGRSEWIDVVCKLLTEPLPPSKPASELAQEVLLKTYERTESWVEQGIGVQLAYLALVILRERPDDRVDWRSEPQMVRLFEQIFPPQHKIWKLIEQ